MSIKTYGAKTMIRISKKRVVLIILAAGVIITLGWQLSLLMVSASPLTETDARKLVKEMYGGEIETVKKTNAAFYVTLQSENRHYNVTVDEKSGEILKVEKKEHKQKEQQLTETEIKRLIQQSYPGKIEQLEKKLEDNEHFYFAVVRKDSVETQLKIHPLSGKIVESSNKKVDIQEDSVHGITEQEARKIALKQINGVVDDVDIEVSDGLNYYLVEVERDKEKEAIVQINAITGEVLSITWDD